MSFTDPKRTDQQRETVRCPRCDGAGRIPKPKPEVRKPEEEPASEESVNRHMKKINKAFSKRRMRPKKKDPNVGSDGLTDESRREFNEKYGLK